MQNSKPILLIEDDRVDAMTVRRALKELGATNQLVRTINGEQALEHLRDKSNEPPCVILMDLNTPKMSGMEFLRIIKAQELLKDIPIVVLTTSDNEHDVSETSQFGVARYLESPLGAQSCSSPSPMMPY